MLSLLARTRTLSCGRAEQVKAHVMPIAIRDETVPSWVGIKNRHFALWSFTSHTETLRR